MKGEGHVMMEAETGVVPPPAKKHQGSPATPEAGGGKGRFFPPAFGGSAFLLARAFRLPASRITKEYISLALSHQFVILCYGAPGKLNVDVPLGVSWGRGRVSRAWALRATRFTWTRGLPENVESRLFAPTCGTGTCGGGAGQPGWKQDSQVILMLMKTLELCVFMGRRGRI